jgi:hypothetical protein
MKLRLHGTRPSAPPPNGCVAPPTSTSRTRAAPTRTWTASWSASTAPSTSTPPGPGGGERPVTGPDPLGPTRRCPRADRCEACGTTRRLDVATYQTPVGVFCATICDPCVDTRNAPPVRSWVEAFERVGAHCGHLAIDLDQMGALLHREQQGGGDGQG